MKKYKLTGWALEHRGNTLYRIEALKDFGDVKAGDKGGWIAYEANLSQEGNCWVYDEAKVYEGAKVSGDAKILNNARVYGKARVYDSALVYDKAEVLGDAHVFGEAQVYGTAIVTRHTEVGGTKKLRGKKHISEHQSTVSLKEYITNE